MFCHQGRPSHEGSSCLPGSVSTRSDVNPLQVEIARGCARVKPIVYADHQHIYGQLAELYYLFPDTWGTLVQKSQVVNMMIRCSSVW
jgi:hypothetical protein